MKERAPNQHCGSESSQAVSRFVIRMVYPQNLVNEARLKPAGQCEPEDSLRNKFYVRHRWKRKLFQNVGSLEPPLLTFYFVLEKRLNPILVQDLARQLVTDT